MIELISVSNKCSFKPLFAACKYPVRNPAPFTKKMKDTFDRGTERNYKKCQQLIFHKDISRLEQSAHITKKAVQPQKIERVGSGCASSDRNIEQLVSLQCVA